MLKELRIENLVLVEKGSIEFGPHFNVLSGETGSGKSAILAALSLVLGERADSSIVRRGCEKGVVEALFSIDQNSLAKQVLAECGIDPVDGDDLVIRREVVPAGKGRCFVNDRIVQSQTLKSLGKSLVDQVAQHATVHLRDLDTHCEWLDLYGSLQDDLSDFRSLWKKEKELQSELNNLIEGESRRLREIEVCRMEIAELDEASVQEGEEEELFAEYTRLTNAEVLYQASGALVDALQQNAIPALSSGKKLWDQLLNHDNSVEEDFKIYKNSLVELQELARSIQIYQERVVFDPARMEEISNRLTLLSKLKRKYGHSTDEIALYHKKAKERLDHLEGSENRIDELEQEIKSLADQVNQSAQHLSNKRQMAAEALETEMTREIHELNMPKATFHVQITPQKRTERGDEQVEFFLAPNIGEHIIALRQHASGGEIARVMLALKKVLIGKESVFTMLVFDEVDANIGGETARKIGATLKELSRSHQVLCITHFPQVAMQADSHFSIAKQEEEGRTFSTIRQLDATGKEIELARMMGG